MGRGDGGGGGGGEGSGLARHRALIEKRVISNTIPTTSTQQTAVDRSDTQVASLVTSRPVTRHGHQEVDERHGTLHTRAPLESI